MKISKLFHWLYASVMLLPVFAIGFKCLYVIFNPNAKDSYFGETINTETKVYNTNGIYTPNTEYYYQFVDYNYSNTINFYTNNFKLINNGNLTSQVITLLNDNPTIRVYCDSSNHRYSFYGNNGYIVATPLGANFIAKFDLLSVDNGGTDLINDFYKLEYNNLSFLDNVLYYSVDQINEMPLFNWASDSFIVAPYRYIGNLFGLDNNSPIYTLLSYWTNVSVIWLVFDLIMYVPLLAHRWLDKGGLE